MALSILNNIASLAAQNQLSVTGSDLQKTLFRLSSGSRINSGADDAAGPVRDVREPSVWRVGGPGGDGAADRRFAGGSADAAAGSGGA